MQLRFITPRTFTVLFGFGLLGSPHGRHPILAWRIGGGRRRSSHTKSAAVRDLSDFKARFALTRSRHRIQVKAC